MNNNKLNEKVLMENVDMDKIKELFEQQELEFNNSNVFNYINAMNILKSCK